MTVTTRADRGRDTAPAGGGRRPQRHRLTTSAERLAAEIVGTFFLVLAAAGGDIIAELHPGQVSPAARAIAPALVVMAMIYALGSVSGAHLNPAVTFAFAVRRVFPWRWVVPYVAAELTGAIVAAATLRLLFSPVGRTGLSYPRGSVAESFGLEVILTLLLVVVILSAATEHRLLGPDAALPTAATIAAAGLVGLSVSGASMNPARSLGPAIVAGIGTNQWIYVVAPLLGAALAVAVTTLCRGAPKDEEHDAAEGDANR